MREIDLWFSVGSTYTYLTIARLDALEKANDVQFALRPFSVRALMLEQNGNPFLNNPLKMKYMWRDVERRAGHYGININLPVSYPIEQFELVNQVALLGMQEGWGRKFVRRFYDLWMVERMTGGSERHLHQSLVDAGTEPAQVIHAASSNTMVDAFAASTDAAREMGLFGSPNFVVDGEVFWGDDRAEDAVCFALEVKRKTRNHQSGDSGSID